MRRRGLVGGGFEIIAEHRADRGLVAFVDAHLLDHCRPKAAGRAFEQFRQRTRLGLESLRPLLGLRQRPARCRLGVARLRERRLRRGGALLGGACFVGMRR